MTAGEVIRKKIDNDDGTMTLIFCRDTTELARTRVNANYDVISLEGAIPDGIVRQYYDSGKLLAEAEYRDNKRDGLTRIYRENDDLWLELNFVKDRAHGITKEYHAGGTSPATAS